MRFMVWRWNICMWAGFWAQERCRMGSEDVYRWGYCAECVQVRVDALLNVDQWSWSWHSALPLSLYRASGWVWGLMPRPCPAHQKQLRWRRAATLETPASHLPVLPTADALTSGSDTPVSVNQVSEHSNDDDDDVACELKGYKDNEWCSCLIKTWFMPVVVVILCALLLQFRALFISSQWEWHFNHSTIINTDQRAIHVWQFSIDC